MIMEQPTGGRRYVPISDDLKPCAKCGDPCFPVPKRNSMLCSWCAYERRQIEAAIDEV